HGPLPHHRPERTSINHYNPHLPLPTSVPDPFTFSNNRSRTIELPLPTHAIQHKLLAAHITNTHDPLHPFILIYRLLVTVIIPPPRETATLLRPRFLTHLLLISGIHDFFFEEIQMAAQPQADAETEYGYCDEVWAAWGRVVGT
ncbi:MAG: hypothetical protein Q9222_007935, partial [Ikaeria aurantiellina]